ncbi:MAG: hypothetical protein JW871_05500 [Endomicrobiales bacterium]|nr:hypothetical protein [Endomicrobiales bacterium]
MKYEQVNELKSSLEKQIDKLNKEQAGLESKISDLGRHIEALDRSKSKDISLNNRLLSLKEELKDSEQSLSRFKAKKSELQDSLIDQSDLQRAMVITSPIWDTLFPAEQKRILDFLLKEVDYDSQTGTLGLTLNENGIKLLNEEVKKGAG